MLFSKLEWAKCLWGRGVLVEELARVTCRKHCSFVWESHSAGAFPYADFFPARSSWHGKNWIKALCHNVQRSRHRGQRISTIWTRRLRIWNQKSNVRTCKFICNRAQLRISSSGQWERVKIVKNWIYKWTMVRSYFKIELWPTTYSNWQKTNPFSTINNPGSQWLEARLAGSQIANSSDNLGR